MGLKVVLSIWTLSVDTKTSDVMCRLMTFIIRRVIEIKIELILVG